ncbi:M24 family metallopeptidase [Bythopirellula polymerisocia]|uniref:Putative peptidase n=1 Tax=Bythopirellula polymerisocia TaxID=2528003 RepID=A0A5C6CJD2_9BACT|nr:Xaa-Pro peptidase family protein [Bythopirellula polymerisocia]TWU23687.1 putative peptidase [Bythopirellula polymerisocia]
MSDDPYGVDVVACKSRQQRLLAEMVEHGLEWVVLTRRESVQWLTGAYVGPLFAPAAAMNTEGRVTLVLPSRKTSLTVAADEVLPYEEKWCSTLRDEQRAASNTVMMSALPIKLRHVGGEWSQLGPDLLADCEGNVINIEPTIFRLRRQKDNDELRMLRRANDANRAMYKLAREIVEPGVNELDVYNELHAVAVQKLGEALTYFGQDFRSNARGGLPRDRKIEAGELYILDLGVGFRGYYSDNARTLAVGGEPSAKQVLAWERVSEVFPLVESTVRPGASCKQLFEEVQSLLDKSKPWVFNHHLGHGVGLAPHEGPHLNPSWDDTFAEGEFFTAEPGLYHEELRAGVRLEENYVVTATGCEKLTDYPLGL